MSWWSDFADQIEFDAPLGRMTWFRLGGNARYLFRPRDLQTLGEMMRRANEENVPVKVLGRGANVLVSDDGFDGLVIRLDSPAFRVVSHRKDEVDAGAGVDLMLFTRQCVRKGLTGLEPMAGIPASIGGAVRMNAGGHHGEFGDVVRRVQVLDEAGELQTCSRAECGFSYRHCGLENKIVVSATLNLHDEDPALVRDTFEQFLAEKQRSQPLADHSAGCVFKNPPGHSAGALIDRAGLKGAGVGRARVSELHANFIVAGRGATASDVLALIDVIRERVSVAFDVELQLEIDVWQPIGEGSLV